MFACVYNLAKIYVLKGQPAKPKPKKTKKTKKPKKTKKTSLPERYLEDNYSIRQVGFLGFFVFFGFSVFFGFGQFLNAIFMKELNRSSIAIRSEPFWEGSDEADEVVPLEIASFSERIKQD